MLQVHTIASQLSVNLEATIDGLLSQTVPFELRVVDMSESGSVGAKIKERAPSAAVLRAARKWSFAEAHNKLLDWARDDKAVLLIESGVILSDDCLEKMVKAMDEDKEAALIGPKILRMYDENADEERLHERVMSDRLDGRGVPLRNVFVRETGMGERDDGSAERVAVAALRRGALLLRIAALADIKKADRYFREKYEGAEEIDFAIRLNRAGWKTIRDDSAAAYKMSGVFSSRRNEKQPWSFLTQLALSASAARGRAGFS
ncbi:MAG: glycosyltransferase [Patescibacteria group bacterium]